MAPGRSRRIQFRISGLGREGQPNGRARPFLPEVDLEVPVPYERIFVGNAVMGSRSGSCGSIGIFGAHCRYVGFEAPQTDGSVQQTRRADPTTAPTERAIAARRAERQVDDRRTDVSQAPSFSKRSARCFSLQAKYLHEHMTVIRRGTGWPGSACNWCGRSPAQLEFLQTIFGNPMFRRRLQVGDQKPWVVLRLPAEMGGRPDDDRTPGPVGELAIAAGRCVPNRTAPAPSAVRNAPASGSSPYPPHSRAFASKNANNSGPENPPSRIRNRALGNARRNRGSSRFNRYSLAWPPRYPGAGRSRTSTAPPHRRRSRPTADNTRCRRSR